MQEYMENGSLHQNLNLRDANGQRMFSWYERGKLLALEVATALHYLHR